MLASGVYEPPGGSVRDYQLAQIPLPELLEKHVGCGRPLGAVGGKILGVDARLAFGERLHLVGKPPEVRVVTPVPRVEPTAHRRLLALGNPLLLRTGRHRADWARRQLVVGKPREDHTPVAVVVLRRAPHLRPLEAQERHQIRVGRVAGPRIALPDAVLLGSPGARCQGFAVIGEREEVEDRAMTGEVAGVGRRVRTLSPDQGEVPRKGVE